MSKILEFKKVERPVTVINKSNDTSEMLIYGDIGGSWGDSVELNDIVDALSGLGKNVKNLDIRISSLGGCCFTGIAIYSRLKQSPYKINVYVDSIAASIASIIAMAGDNIYMGDGTEIMIHSPWTFAAGNVRDLQATIERLDDVEENLITIYQKKTGLSRSEIKDYMVKETFFNADEAIKMGFASAMADESETYNFAASLNKERAGQWLKRMPNTNKYTAKLNKELKNDIKDIEDFLAR